MVKKKHINLIDTSDLMMNVSCLAKQYFLSIDLMDIKNVMEHIC